MSGIRSRRKGANGERELVNLLKAKGLNARRIAMLQTNRDNNDPDVDVADHPELHIECKRGKKVNVHAAMRQAIKASTERSVPCVMYRNDGDEWLAILRVTDLIDYMNGANDDDEA